MAGGAATGSGAESPCDGPTRLVVGIDGSDTSWRALYYALGLARRQHSTVIALFAMPRPAAPTVATGEVHQSNLALADELRPAIQDLAEQYHVPVEFVTRTGDPATTLTELVSEHRADALVLGASQALGHRLFGSTAVRAVRRCCCPVTVVP